MSVQNGEGEVGGEVNVSNLFIAYLFLTVPSWSGQFPLVF